MTLSNLKTEKSLVEKAANTEKGQSEHTEIMSYPWFSCTRSHPRGHRLTQDSCHGQDEELEQRVLLLIGEPEKPQLGHFHIKCRG